MYLSLSLSMVCPSLVVEAMVCLESITARTSLSNWLVIDGSIPPATPYTILVFIIVIVLFIIVLDGSIQLTPCTVLQPSALIKYWWLKQHFSPTLFHVLRPTSWLSIKTQVTLKQTKFELQSSAIQCNPVHGCSFILQNTKVHLEPCGFGTQDNCPNFLLNASADDFVQVGFYLSLTFSI